MFSQASIILSIGERVSADIPLGRHPLADTLPQADTLQADTLYVDTPLETATAADGTRATGMHSSLCGLFY